jgi:hypothetical protein
MTEVKHLWDEDSDSLDFDSGPNGPIVGIKAPLAEGRTVQFS